MKERDFLENKKIALKKLEKAIKENLADEDIIPILDLINHSEDYFTSSSCYGRTVLLEIPVIGNKKDLENRQISADSAKKLAEQFNLMYLETSALSGENVDHAFTTLAKQLFESRK